MMPSAKIVSLDSDPPEKISRNPGSAPPCFCRNSESASPLIPGVGIWAPTRYSTSIPSVNRMRVRCSGIFRIFGKLVRSGPNTRDNLVRSSRCLNLRLSRLAELVRLHGNGFLHLAIAQYLDRQCDPLNQARIDHRLRRNGARSWEICQTLNIDDCVFFPEGIGEAVLRDATNERHLAAFEPRLLAASGASQQSLMTFRCRLPMTRAGATSNALPFFLGAFSRREIV